MKLTVNSLRSINKGPRFYRDEANSLETTSELCFGSLELPGEGKDEVGVRDAELEHRHRVVLLRVADDHGRHPGLIVDDDHVLEKKIPNAQELFLREAFILNSLIARHRRNFPTGSQSQQKSGRVRQRLGQATFFISISKKCQD